MASDRKYNKQGLLVGLDGYKLPIRLKGRLLDSQRNSLLFAIGRDAVSFGNDVPGGNIDPGEYLASGALRENREETGFDRDSRIVSKDVVTIMSNTKDDLVEEAEYGDEVKLCAMFRSVSTVQPTQQEARTEIGELVPEFINPRFEFLHPELIDYMLFRPSALNCLKRAKELGWMDRLESTEEVKPNLTALGDQWTKWGFHPDFVEFYCTEHEDYVSGENDAMDAVVKNLRYADIGLSHILRHPLKHNKEIQEMLDKIRPHITRKP